MLQDNLQNGIVVKTKDGVFKLLKNGQLEELASEDVKIEKKEALIVAPPLVKNETSAEKKATAEFYFTVDDERDIRELRDNEGEQKNRRIREFIDRTVESIIRVAEEAGIISLPGQTEQVRKIIFSRLKDIRSLTETREALASSLIMRNKPLGKREIDLLITLVEKQRVKVEEAIRNGVAEKKEAPEAPKPEPGARPAPTQANIIIEPKEQERPIEKKDNLGVQYGQDEKDAGYYQHIITGPIEEIKNLSLVDFRRLGVNPDEAAGRIWEKINLLEDESLIKKDEGTKAWRQSEIYRLYLTIGAESMAEKKSVNQVILERKAAGKPFLLPEEFNAVADLNRRLTY